MFPALPFSLWNKDFLTGLANSLGSFVVVKKYFHRLFDKRMTMVLVDLDVSKSLLTEIDSVCNDLVILQRLDYLKVPFRCIFSTILATLEVLAHLSYTFYLGLVDLESVSIPHAPHHLRFP